MARSRKCWIVFCWIMLFSTIAMAGPIDDMLLNGVERNDLAMVRKAVEYGGNVNYNRNGTTPLHQAVENRNQEIACFLLTKGAFVDVGGIGSQEGKKTNLMYAVQNGDYSMVQLLITAGENVNAANVDGNTALIFAMGDNVDGRVVRCLIENKAQVNQTNNMGSTPLMVLANNWWNFRERNEVAKELLMAGADPKVKNKNRDTALSYAIAKGNKALIDILLPISPKD